MFARQHDGIDSYQSLLATISFNARVLVLDTNEPVFLTCELSNRTNINRKVDTTASEKVLLEFCAMN